MLISKKLPSAKVRICMKISTMHINELTERLEDKQI